jgi:two-component system NtrC family response regulator
MKHILVIDDEKSLRLMIRAMLEDADWTVHEAESAEKALTVLSGPEGGDIRVILLDVGLPGMTGHELLPRLKKEYPSVPVVMLTAYGTVGSAVEAMKNGAFEYLTKPADNDELTTVAEKAFEQANLLRENTRLKSGLAGDDPLAALVGGGPAMRKLHEFIRHAAPSESTVLILGESGTGNELIADALHALESELFGYAKGAFTGAVKTSRGAFSWRTKAYCFWMRWASCRRKYRLNFYAPCRNGWWNLWGAVKPESVDVRIIAATNRNLARCVEEGTFREDLYFRLNVLEVIAPPLRDRTEDLPALSTALLERLCAKKNKKDVRGVNAPPAEAGGFK